MSGQGNYGSGPPFQQCPPPPPLQQGPPSLRRPIYQHGPPPPEPVQSSGMNLGQQYINCCPPPPPPPPPSMQVHGSSQVPQYYSTGQHHSQWAQNLSQIRPELPTSVSGNAVQPSSLGQGQSSNPLPPPPCNSYSYPMSQVAQLPSMVPSPPLPTSLPQALARPLALPPGTSTYPAQEVRFSVDDLDQSCSKDSRSEKRSSDSVERVTTPDQSGDNLPARGNFLEYDGDTSSLQHHSLTDADTSHSPTNSDMDMEDDFAHPAEDEPICLSNIYHGSSSEPPINLKTAVEQDSVFVGLDISNDHESGSRNSFQISDSSILSKESELQVNSLTHRSSCPHEAFDQSSLSVDLAGNDFDKSVNHTAKKTNPLKLLGDYAFDDSAENSEAHVRPAKQELASFLPSDRVADICKHMKTNSSDDHEQNNLFNSLVESSGVSLGLLESDVKPQSDIPEAGCSAARDFENSIVQEIGSQKTASKVGSSLEIIRGDATKGISQKEEQKSASGIAKVDEFGRLIREDHSDVDSGDPPQLTRRICKRGRSRSLTQSPIRGRNRSRSRSPRGRRSSRSRSPGRRSSRSRSPRGRRSSRSRSPRGRRSRSRSLRGRRSSRSHSPRGRRRSPRRRQGRHGRSRSFSPKRHQSRSKSPSYRRGGEFCTEKTRRQKGQLPDCLDYIRNKCYRGESCRYLHRHSDKTNDRLRSSQMKHQNDVLPITKGSNVYGDTDPISPKRSVHKHKEHDESQIFNQEVVSFGEKRGAAEELSDGPTKLPYTETSIGAPVHLDTYTKVPSDISNCQTQLMDDQAAAESSLQTSTPAPSQVPTSRPDLNKDSSSTSFSHPVSKDQPFTSESTMPRSYLPELPPSFGNHSSNLLVGNSLTLTNHIPRDYNLIHQQSQFPLPSTTAHLSLPPPPPFPFPYPNNLIGNTTSGLPSAQFQHNMQPPYSDYHYQASTGVGQPVMYPQMSEPYRYDANLFGPRIMPVMSKPMNQIHGPSSHTHPYMHHSPGNLHPAPDGIPTYYGEPGNTIATLSNCSSDNPEVSQSQHFTDLGRSRPSHFLPLVSTLNEALTSKFYSDATQRKDVPYCDIYGTPYSLNHASEDRVTAKDSFPAPAGDQYDPLSDSIEPSSSSMKKPDISQMLPTNNSGVMLRTSGFNQFLDVDGDNKLKGTEGVQGSLSVENYEYGETADAEVGDVEDGSASNPQSAADMAAEEDEINQDKASGKTKKGKDSKSMKFFKIAIADFVKEVLKPSWRQGNMSKEAFKTIVKKTVDKVSAATGKRHIPKSRERMDYYIDSQQRKLTKLVMGYVDKYVNA